MQKNLQLFKTKIRLENGYYRLHVTHPKFKGRIRKRLGNLTQDESETVALNIQFELGRQFGSTDITKESVDNFVESYISLNVKRNASIFDYVDEFLESKRNTINRFTKKPLSNSTLSGYKTALDYLEQYYKRRGIPSDPSYITSDSLDGFYMYLKLKGKDHNYIVKLHTKVKGFIKYLIEQKNISIDSRYKLSTYAEEYDNQNPEEDDIAISESDVKKLIELRRKIKAGEVVINSDHYNKKIPPALKVHNTEKLKKNIILSLDCFLFMISTGQYWADIRKTTISISSVDDLKHIRYRRAKNGSLCKAIPVQDDDVFIAGEIMKQYRIKNNTNFPLGLSLTHFDKHLKRISLLLGLDYYLTNKMARKTFASILYFNRELPIHLLQILLGHKDVKDTAHYLRIEDDEIAKEINKRIAKPKSVA